jgi:hypothetical protein
MPALKNQKHEAFAQAVALGMPASQAYVECVSRDGKCTERTAEVEGSKLANDEESNPEVTLRIAELRKGVGETAEKKFNLTKETWLDRLEGIASKAEEVGDLKAATGALAQVGKAMAFYAPEEVKHSGSIEIPGLADAVALTFGRK